MTPESAAMGLVFGGLGGCYAVARIWRMARHMVSGSLR